MPFCLQFNKRSPLPSFWETRLAPHQQQPQSEGDTCTVNFCLTQMNALQTFPKNLAECCNVVDKLTVLNWNGIGAINPLSIAANGQDGKLVTWSLSKCKQNQMS